LLVFFIDTGFSISWLSPVASQSLHRSVFNAAYNTSILNLQPLCSVKNKAYKSATQQSFINKQKPGTKK